MHKKVSVGAMGAALAAVLIILSSYLPTGRAAMLFAASAAVYTAGLVGGAKTAAAAYAASSLIAALLSAWASPNIIAAYIICFGNYPFFKQIFAAKTLLVRALIKSALYIAYFAAAYAVFKYFIPADMKFSPAILFIIGAFLFAAYDILLGRIGEYASNIVRR